MCSKTVAIGVSFVVTENRLNVLIANLLPPPRFCFGSAKHIIPKKYLFTLLFGSYFIFAAIRCFPIFYVILLGHWFN